MRLDLNDDDVEVLEAALDDAVDSRRGSDDCIDCVLGGELCADHLADEAKAARYDALLTRVRQRRPVAAVVAALPDETRTAAHVRIAALGEPWAGMELDEQLAELVAVDDYLEHTDRVWATRASEIAGIGSEFFRPAWLGLLYALGQEPGWLAVRNLMRLAANDGRTP